MRGGRSLVLLLIVAGLAAPVLANTPPHAPVLIEPALGINPDPADVHMATDPFVDDDPGDTHLSSDWELWKVDTNEPVWIAHGVTGVLAVHIHLGDGTYVTPDGRLLGATQYQVRVRFQDSSGDPATEWSDWSTRNFTTSLPSAIQSLQLVDILSIPPPKLTDSLGSQVPFPDGSSLTLESESGQTLLSYSGVNGQTQVDNPPALPNHAHLKVLVIAGSQPLSLPATIVDFYDDIDQERKVYLPAITLDPVSTEAFWIAQDGSSYAALVDGETPDFTTVEQNAPTPWQLFDPSYRIELVSGKLQLPVNIAFVPSPLPDADAPIFYVTELYGNIKSVLRDGTVRDYATGLLNYDPTGVFPGSGEQGTAGTAVDPDTGDLFVSVVYAVVSGDHYPRVVRLHSADGGRTMASETTVLDMAGEAIGPSHQISSITIGPDKKLYVHVGDGFFTQFSQDLTSFRGKILRVNMDGTAPTDNPFYNAADGITATDYIYAYGFRNPFGGTWRSADQSHYEAEDGPSVDRLAKVIPGFNFGYDGSDASMLTGAIYNWLSSVAPVNIAFVQRDTFGGSEFPDDRMDHAYVSESGPTWSTGIPALGKSLREFVFGNPVPTILSTSIFLQYIGSGKATVAAVAAGPDGLYFSDLYPDDPNTLPSAHDADIYRIRFVGSASIKAGLLDLGSRTVAFSPVITVPTYSHLSWDFGDGTISEETTPHHAFASSGRFDVRLSAIVNNETIEGYEAVDFAPQMGTGLLAKYTDRRTGRTFSRTEANIDVDWDGRAPVLPIGSDPFSTVWTGELAIPVADTYTFAVRGIGTINVWVDRQEVIPSAALQSGTDVTGSIALDAGEHHRVTIVYEGSSSGGVHLLFSTPTQPEAVVSPMFFYPVPDPRTHQLDHPLP